MTKLKTEEISILLNDLDKDRECGSTLENELVEIVKRGNIDEENYVRSKIRELRRIKPFVPEEAAYTLPEPKEDLMDDSSEQDQVDRERDAEDYERDRENGLTD